jgi:hypothetical protein
VAPLDNVPGEHFLVDEVIEQHGRQQGLVVEQLLLGQAQIVEQGDERIVRRCEDREWPGPAT